MVPLYIRPLPSSTRRFRCDPSPPLISLNSCKSKIISDRKGDRLGVELFGRGIVWWRRIADPASVHPAALTFACRSEFDFSDLMSGFVYFVASRECYLLSLLSPTGENLHCYRFCAYDPSYRSADIRGWLPNDTWQIGWNLVPCVWRGGCIPVRVGNCEEVVVLSAFEDGKESVPETREGFSMIVLLIIPETHSIYTESDALIDQTDMADQTRR